MPHEEDSCPRPRKQTRDKIKERILQLFIANPANLHDELQSEARQHPYALRIIRGYLQDEIAITWDDSDLQAKWRPEGLVFSVWLGHNRPVRPTATRLMSVAWDVHNFGQPSDWCNFLIAWLVGVNTLYSIYIQRKKAAVLGSHLNLFVTPAQWFKLWFLVS